MPKKLSFSASYGPQLDQEWFVRSRESRPCNLPVQYFPPELEALIRKRKAYFGIIAWLLLSAPILIGAITLVCYHMPECWRFPTHPLVDLAFGLVYYAASPAVPAVPTFCIATPGGEQFGSGKTMVRRKRACAWLLRPS